MSFIEEKRKAIISEMEAGRGSSSVLPHPVPLEPPYKPYNLRHLDSSRRPLFGKLFGSINDKCVVSARQSENERLRFVRIKPSREDDSTFEIAAQFILSLPPQSPVSFEIIGQEGKISFQIAARADATDTIISQLRAHYPDAESVTNDDLIKTNQAARPVARAYRLKQSHFFPLSPATSDSLDPLKSLFGHLSNLKAGEFAVVQVLFIRVEHDWPDNMRRASRNPHDPAGSPFVDLPYLPKTVDKKLAKPLLAVSIRVLASSGSLLSSLQGIFSQFESQENGIEPVTGNYPAESIFQRNTFVHGTILNLTELSYFVHLPEKGILSSIPTIEEAAKTNPVPLEFTSDGPVLGINEHRGIKTLVRHSRGLPNMHTYAIGKSGFGKSNLLLGTVLQRIEQGEGVGVLDPHGQLVRKDILPRIPKERVKDTIFFNAGDFDFPVNMNPLAHTGTKAEKEHIRVDLLDFFESLFESALGVNVLHCVNFFLISLLEFNDSTLFDMERLLIDKSWRKEFVARLKDERVRIFWEQEFPMLEKKGIATAIANKLSPLLLPSSVISPMLARRENKINFRDIMDNEMIFIASLAHGDIGKRNSQLLGKLLLSRLQIAAMMREAGSSDWFLYVDEFQNLTSPSMMDILSGARKFGVSLWLTNQMMGDVPEPIMRHVYNASTMIFFASDSPSDQSTIEKVLSRKFKAEDIGRLKRGETFVKMVSHTFNMRTELVLDMSSRGYADEIIAASRVKYAVVSDPKPQSRNQKPATLAQKQYPLPGRIAETALPVTSEERAFLEHVYKNPGLSVTKIYKAAGVSAYMGDKLKTTLKDKNLVREVTTHLGQGSRIAKFLLLTPDGFKALGAEFDNGKGGILHRYWQSVIRVHAESLGYAVNVEEQISGSKEAVDIGLTKAGQQLAIEISVTTPVEHELGNAGKCLDAGYGFVITLFLEENKLYEFETLIKEKFPDKERSKIKTGLAYDFCRFL